MASLTINESLDLQQDFFIIGQFYKVSSLGDSNYSIPYSFNTDDFGQTNCNVVTININITLI